MLYISDERTFSLWREHPAFRVIFWRKDFRKLNKSISRRSFILIIVTGNTAVRKLKTNVSWCGCKYTFSVIFLKYFLTAKSLF